MGEPLTGPLGSPGSRVLVTGAAGGLGSHIVKRLLDAGCDVVATDLVSQEVAPLWHDLTPSARERLVWHRLDLARQAQELDALVRGCDAVVHAAAMVSLTEEYEAFAQVNVEVVRRLVVVSQRQGVKHFVHISCGSLYKSVAGMLHEGAELEAQNGYERSKLEAEQCVEAVGVGGPMAWTILRPGMLYGPYCHTMSASFITLPPILHRFISYLPGLTGGPRTSWCHAEDAAQAAALVLGQPSAYGQRFNVADPTPLSFGEVITAMMEAYGLEVVASVLPFPSAALTLALPLLNHDVLFEQLRKVMRQLWRRVQMNFGLEGPLRPRVDRKALFYAAGDKVLDTSALAALGWRAKYHDYREGIVPTLRWYQEHGWAPRFDSHTLLEQRERARTRGFGFNETLKGVLRDDHAFERAAHLELDVEFPPISQLSPRFYGTLDGQVEIAGLASGAPLQGTVAIDWLGDAGVTYELGFKGDDGLPYRFKGHKDLDWRRPVASLERLEGTLFDQRGLRVGHAELEFTLADQWVGLLVSMRFLMRARQERSG